MATSRTTQETAAVLQHQRGDGSNSSISNSEQPEGHPTISTPSIFADADHSRSTLIEQDNSKFEEPPQKGEPKI